MTTTLSGMTASEGWDQALARLPAVPWAALLDALDDAPGQVVVFTGPEHRLAFQNRASASALGPRRLGAPARTTFVDHPDYVLGLEQVYSSGEGLSLRQSPMALGPEAVGAKRPALVDASFSPLRDEAGAVCGVIWQAVDVTSRYADDERLRVAVALSRVSLDLSRSLEVEQVTATVTKLAAEVFGGWALLDLWQSDGSIKRVAATHHNPQMQPLVEKLKTVPRISGRAHGEAEPYAVQTARTGHVLVGDLDLEALVISASSPEHSELLRQLKPRWFMSVPVQIGPRRLGALSVVRSDGSAPFKPADRAVLEQFAERAAIALAHAGDYDEQRQSALALQRNLLPVQPQTVPGLEVAVRYRAGGTGSQVGGDWYDTVPLRDGLGVAVGDVQGHDLAAAALMGQVRAVVHSHGQHGIPPSRIAKEANTFVVGSAASDCLVTLTYLQVYPSQGRVVWARAGHLPALLVRPGGRVDELVGRGGLPLGVSAYALWEDDEAEVSAGCLLAIFTDGLVESVERDVGKGMRDLADALSVRAEEDLEVLADELLGELALDGPVRDDVALVLLRLAPVAEGALAPL